MTCRDSKNLIEIPYWHFVHLRPRRDARRASGAQPTIEEGPQLPHRKPHVRATPMTLNRTTARFRAPIVMGAVLCALLLIITPHAAISAGVRADTVIAATNRLRVAHGTDPLREDAQLDAAAQRRAEEIITSGRFSHVRPAEGIFASAAQEAGYRYALLGENLAMDFLHEESLVRAWMESPEHRKNLLNARYEHTGVGVAFGTVQGLPTIVVVELFGTLQDPILRGWEPLPAAVPIG